MDASHYTRNAGALRGLLEGLALDYQLNDGELGSLDRVLAQAVEGSGAEASAIVDRLRDELAAVLADGVVTEDEREDLLALFFSVIDEGDDVEDVPEGAVIERLLGVIDGVLADGLVSEQETVDLDDLLEEFGPYQARWPFTAVRALLSRVANEGYSSQTATVTLRGLASDIRAHLASAVGG
jgi:hypothetical protein